MKIDLLSIDSLDFHNLLVLLKIALLLKFSKYVIRDNSRAHFDKYSVWILYDAKSSCLKRGLLVLLVKIKKYYWVNRRLRRWFLVYISHIFLHKSPPHTDLHHLSFYL